MNPLRPGLVIVVGLLWPAGDEPDPLHDDAAPRTAEWSVIEPGGDTGCAFGSPFRFFYRAGPDPSRLTVYFQGGGACWDWVSCSGMFDTNVADDELAEYAGIFDFDNPDNPFADDSILFIPYCTGDVHVGDAVVEYGDPAWGAPPVAHRGDTNVRAALDWASDNGARPERLVITGASAGSYGALFHAPNVVATFPATDVVVIGDSGVPLLHEYRRILERWGAAGPLARTVRSDDPGDGVVPTLEEAIGAFARLRPDARIALITTDRDAVQAAFYLFSGSPDWRGETLRMLRTLDAQIPTFRAFVLDGTDHGLMRVDRFYEYRQQDHLLRNWIADLVDGMPVVSRYCVACD